MDIAKEDSYFAHFAYLEVAATPIFEQLTKEHFLAGLDVNAFSERAAYYMGELNALHPFRDGNGRTQREFINLLANKNRYFIAWTNITQDEMVRASIDSFRGNTSKFQELLRTHITSTSQE